MGCGVAAHGWKDVRAPYAGPLTHLATKRPHEILGVSETASPATVREAYLRLTKTYHPDRADPFMAGHNQEMLKLINAAYSKMKASFK